MLFLHSSETGVMCRYTIDSAKISAKGLYIYFCVSVLCIFAAVLCSP